MAIEMMCSYTDCTNKIEVTAIHGSIPSSAKEATPETILCDEHDVCEHCGGEGMVSVNAPVYRGEPHMAAIDQQPCVCQAKDDEDNF